MLQPVRRRTWAPRGQTPLHNAWDRHDRLSAIGAISVSPKAHRLALYFQLLAHNVRTEDMLWFLCEMHRYFGRKIILVWDRSGVHRCAAACLESLHPEWFQFEWLPAYAPELNPVEQCWNHTKYHDLPNFIPKNLARLEAAVSETIARQSRNSLRANNG